MRVEGTAGNRTVAQLCGTGRRLENVLGISINTTGDLAAIGASVENSQVTATFMRLKAVALALS